MPSISSDRFNSSICSYDTRGNVESDDSEPELQNEDEEHQEDAEIGKKRSPPNKFPSIER